MQTSKVLIITMVMAGLSVAGPASAEMSVEEAYRAIPHRRTVFDLDAAKMSREEQAYLQELFSIVDLAIVERVEMLMWLWSRGERGELAQDYDDILSQLSDLTIPPQLQNVHQLVVEAIEEQRAALQEWQGTGVPANLPRHPLVTSSSRKLRRAYGELLRLFPREGRHNKAAFFDYLCALDFI
ncbi:MAG: hypothetical protein ACE5MG_04530 [Candidatus Methylomirabilales bacterium]